MIEEAAQYKVQLIVFPEMSLTGYERERAKELAFKPDDIRLNAFIQKAELYQLTIVIGAPIKIDSNLYIGAFIIQPDGSITIYTKQFLHDGEEKFFSAGLANNSAISIANEKVSVAICADITNPLHPENAHNKHTNLYIASLFYTPNGIAEAYEQLGQYAEKYQMNVLMANYCGESYSFKAAGQSAYWNKKGKLLASVANEEGLLIIDSDSQEIFLPFEKSTQLI
ncbi:carbon-nitrogen hydrolase family protein [Emticicia fontis]